MRIVRIFKAICLLAVTPYSAMAQSADPNADACAHKSGNEAITACTALIPLVWKNTKIIRVVALVGIEN